MDIAKDSLAGLAKELKQCLNLQPQGSSHYDRVLFCAPAVIDKVQRIVAELAKQQEAEEFLYEKYDAETARRIVRQTEGNAILKCRAIAEE